MDDSREERIKSIEGLRLENEEADQRATLAERKAIEREAKQRYGRDWKSVLGVAGRAVRSVHVDADAMHDLYGMGIDTDQRLRDSNRPRRSRR